MERCLQSMEWPPPVNSAKLPMNSGLADAKHRLGKFKVKDRNVRPNEVIQFLRACQHNPTLISILHSSKERFSSGSKGGSFPYRTSIEWLPGQPSVMEQCMLCILIIRDSATVISISVSNMLLILCYSTE